MSGLKPSNFIEPAQLAQVRNRRQGQYPSARSSVRSGRSMPGRCIGVRGFSFRRGAVNGLRRRRVLREVALACRSTLWIATTYGAPAYA